MFVTSNLGHNQKVERHKSKEKREIFGLFHGKVSFIELTPRVWISS
jgi:hypothetical protein